MAATRNSSVIIEPINIPKGSEVNFGAVIRNVDIENVTDAQFAEIRNALFRHQVLVFKDQAHVSPKAQFELTRRFNPGADSAQYGHAKTVDAKRDILHPDLKACPNQPQVHIIGNGHVDEYEGLRDFTLRHPHHRTFHKTRVTEAEDLGATRFYRWHIDAALYGHGRLPPVATTLLAVKVPRGRRQVCRYDDGTGDELDVPLGTTAFVSGEAMYDRLSDADKALARATRVEYAPHPFVWMSAAKSRPTGLGLESDGLELPDAELPAVDPTAVQILPMCWRNRVTGRLALQVAPSAVRRLHIEGRGVVDDLAEARAIVYHLQRPAIAPARVYAHDWQEGDLVLFHNRGVLHSVVGAFAPDEVRLFRQCNIAATTAPEGPRPDRTPVAAAARTVGLAGLV